MSMLLALLIPPPPPIIIPAPRAGSDAALYIVRYSAAGAECDGAPVTFERAPRPLVDVAQGSFGRGEASAPDVTLTFRVDASGRPLSIKHGGSTAPSRPIYADESDLEPALAEARLAPRQEFRACRVTFRAEAVPAAEAPLSLLSEAALSPLARRERRQVLEWMAPAGSDCLKRRPEPHVLAYPDRRRVRSRPGALDFATLAFDVDSKGRATNARFVHSTGNRSLEREMLRTLELSRFEGKPVTGCLVNFGLPVREVLPAPERRPFEEVGKSPEGCPANAELKFRMRPQFPANFRRRSIEGWAVVRYDVAPWGAVGNVEVLAAEPAATFGTAARDAISTAEAPKSDKGRSGCIAPFSFRMDDNPAADEE